MKDQIDLLKVTRNNFKQVIDSLDHDRLVKIPEGFRNNVLWNTGHALTTCGLLVYGRAGLPLRLDDDFVAHYRKGSVPDGSELKDLEFITGELSRGVDDLYELVRSGQPRPYDPFMTSYNYMLNTWEDAIRFNNVHESLHLGYVMAMVRNL